MAGHFCVRVVPRIHATSGDTRGPATCAHRFFRAQRQQLLLRHREAAGQRHRVLSVHHPRPESCRTQVGGDWGSLPARDQDIRLGLTHSIGEVVPRDAGIQPRSVWAIHALLHHLGDQFGEVVQLLQVNPAATERECAGRIGPSDGRHREAEPRE